MRRVAAALLLVLPASAATPATGNFISASGIAWQAHAFRDQRGEEQHYFVSGTAPAARTVVILQGSGCVPAFAQIQGRANISTSLQDSFAKAAAGRAKLLIVERPGLRRNDPLGPTPGQSEGCPLAFRARYSLEDWGAVVQRAFADYRRNESRSAIMALVGISEGTKTAVWLARHGFRGPVASFGGADCDGDMVGMLARARRRERAHQPGPSPAEEARTIAQIRADPMAIDRFAWGHTFLRWSTFGDQCHREGLERHPALVFLAYGAKDPGADVAEIERLAHRRQAMDLPVTVERIEGGDHGLSVGDQDKAPATFGQFLNAVLR